MGWIFDPQSALILTVAPPFFAADRWRIAIAEFDAYNMKNYFNEKRGTPEVSKTVRGRSARRSRGTPYFRFSCKVPLFATKLPKLLRLW
jgi:hypothetical protein